ncbi:hypothetical protein [Rhodothermus marinus]|uniref:hypothetical protein n=1 Tax=Rhodothermus marinus TaxID=29549 RepID=UPI000AFC1973|nr:hypothetical protein [Rhodothermus marinus]
MRSIPAVKIAALYTADGRLFAWSFGGASPTALPAQLPASGGDRETLRHVEPVHWEGQTQGYLYLQASLLGWRTRMKRYAP